MSTLAPRALSIWRRCRARDEGSGEEHWLARTGVVLLLLQLRAVARADAWQWEARTARRPVGKRTARIRDGVLRPDPPSQRRRHSLCAGVKSRTETPQKEVTALSGPHMLACERPKGSFPKAANGCAANGRACHPSSRPQRGASRQTRRLRHLGQDFARGCFCRLAERRCEMFQDADASRRRPEPTRHSTPQLQTQHRARSRRRFSHQSRARTPDTGILQCNSINVVAHHTTIAALKTRLTCSTHPTTLSSHSTSRSTHCQRTGALRERGKRSGAPNVSKKNKNKSSGIHRIGLPKPVVESS